MLIETDSQVGHSYVSDPPYLVGTQTIAINLKYMYLSEGYVNIRPEAVGAFSKNGLRLNSPETALFLSIIITRVCCFNSTIFFVAEMAFPLYLNLCIKAKL